MKSYAATSGPPKPAISLARRAFGLSCIGIGVFCLTMLDQVDIVVNATRSLEAKAFVLFDQPVMLQTGAVVAATMPDVLAEKFGEHLYVKKIGGLPGDTVTVLQDGTPCIRNVCYALARKDGAPLGPSLPEGVIPEGYYALFGDGETSLDSRYAAIGLISADKLRGRGWAIPWYQDWRGHSQ